MSTATVSPPDLLTAEEYGRRPSLALPDELLEGKVVPMPVPKRRHGQICNKAGRIFGNFADEHDLGHVLSNDAGVITRRNPDTVRGPDVAFYSCSRLPKGPLPQSYGPEVPELVVEVRSPSDRWADLLAKVAEYLAAGVLNGVSRFWDAVAHCETSASTARREPRTPEIAKCRLAVLVLDEESQTALLQFPDAMPRLLSIEQELTLPAILPGFAVCVRQFFD